MISSPAMLRSFILKLFVGMFRACGAPSDLLQAKYCSMQLDMRRLISGETVVTLARALWHPPHAHALSPIVN